MVNVGKPSKGCSNCKKRKIKCDENTPACNNCRRTSRKCPGYASDVDLMFRDQTKKIVQKTGIKGLALLQNTTKPLVWGSPISTSTVTSEESLTTEHWLLSLTTSSKQQDQLSFAAGGIILPPPWLPVQQQAVQVIFNNFNVLHGHAFDVRNFLSLLAPMYETAPGNSPLRIATEAGALSLFSLIRNEAHVHHVTAIMYGKAVRAVAMALKDPASAATNETLQSIILLSYYESIRSSDTTLHFWAQHIAGATAIVRKRGLTQFLDPISRTLFRAVREETIIDSLRRGTQPAEFPGPRGWLSDRAEGICEPDDPVGFMFSEQSIQLPALRSKQSHLMTQPKTEATKASMYAIVNEALALCNEMQESLLPDKLRPRTISFMLTKPEDPSTSEAWMGPVHTYLDIYTANQFNKLRSCRILLARIVAKGMRWIRPDDYSLRQGYQHAVYVEREAIDLICSSVPCHFGWTDRFSPLWLSNSSLTDQALPPEAKFIEVQTTANLVAGYLLQWPLRVSQGSCCIDETQRKWIQHRLGDVANRCGLGQASLSVS